MSYSGNHLRNILIGGIVVFSILEFCFYLSGILFYLFVDGPDGVDFKAVNPSLTPFPQALWPTIFDHIQYCWYHPELYGSELIVKLIVSSVLPIIILMIILWNLRERIIEWRPFKKKESLHGDSKWASEKDIRKAGLRSKKGLLLGKDKRGYFIADGYQHTLLFAPTGSGKGVGFVIPNLLFWTDSVIVHDIKLENYEITSGWRERQGQEVYVWNPAQPDGISHCYNPLEWISEKPGQMVDDVQKIANLIMPEQDFWQNEARSLFVGVVLYLLATPEKVKSFGEVVRTMRSDDVVYNLAVVLDTMGKVIHPVAYMNIAAFLQKADKERSGVVSTMNSSLELWANPLIDTATTTSDFNILDFKKKKVTVYVGLTPDNLNRLRPLMQVFYQQATEFLCRKLPLDDEPYGVLFLMDEFPTLGKMEQFQTGIAYFRGYRVRLFLIVQDTEQLKGIYEEAGMNSFLSNSTYRITFAANNIETANLISQLIGNKTVQQESLNKPKFLDLNPASRSLHISETQRALLLPQEIIMLPRDEQIILIESTYPIKSKKVLYYNDSAFTRKLFKPTRVPTQEPYDPNKVFSVSNSRVSDEEENDAVVEGTNTADCPIEAQAENEACDESEIDDKFKDGSIGNEGVEDKFEDEESDNEFEDEFEDEKDDDRFDGEEDEFEDENIGDESKNSEK
ncbi:type IV secretory system conjugative DNA transfer family protein [Wolbachia endosymbiont of Dirofilaria (Dirofilaria) immitis]|uniref:Type IV secretion system protein virD4 n=1 Tax=Wolbachia endosymbiont of Dirofilaria immitis TaxID=82301 RepID=A4V6Q1_9RICK|nr:type IV secretory system conjugative DNA transfer family protein [Wolbachia endosymbiont of Dirofilaria (Dirofilaria) immitis]QKX02377.1 TraM recognition domain-containing protein [Wolbachia endosymbiont of Dirofilaria (Dirofilaria) immitis]CAJ41436.1 type IV secretion system protein virD4 [Wolbachia endosymbiont of Dirofilaria immitis]